MSIKSTDIHVCLLSIYISVCCLLCVCTYWGTFISDIIENRIQVIGWQLAGDRGNSVDDRRCAANDIVNLCAVDLWADGCVSRHLLGESHSLLGITQSTVGEGYWAYKSEKDNKPICSMRFMTSWIRGITDCNASLSCLSALKKIKQILDILLEPKSQKPDAGKNQ